MRIIAMLAGLAAVAAATAAGAEEASRYVLQESPHGIVRLDTVTGAMSQCTPSGSGLACRLMADDRAAYEAEIKRLEAENRDLRLKLSRLTPDGTGPAPDTTLKLPDDRDIDQMMGFFEKVFRRIMDLARTLRDEAAGQGT